MDAIKEESSIKNKIETTLSGLIVNGDFGSLSRENIWARAKGFMERVFLLDSAPRIMPMVEKKILDVTGSGRSFPGCCCWWAKALSSAKGRMDRIWWAPRGGLYLCISLFPQLLVENQQLYSLAAGLSVCHALWDLGFYGEIRWVNDVLVSGKKICGILSKAFFAPKTKETYLLFGMGLNVNTKAFPAWLSSTATSMEIESGRKWPIEDVGILVISHLMVNFSMLHEWEAWCLRRDVPFHQGENPMIQRYKDFCPIENRKVLYGRAVEERGGTPFVSRGITPNGSIILEDINGDILLANSGEIRHLD